MHQSFRSLSLLALAGFALAACGDTVVQPTEISAPAFSAGGNSGPSASGAGHFEIDDDLRTFSFHANTAKDGSVRGQAQLNNRFLKVVSHIEVNCLRVEGNTAYVSGVVSRHSTNPLLEGRGALWSVQDNGEGANAQPDLISLAFLGGPPLDWCRSFIGVITPANAIKGNIQVKP